MDDTLLSLLAHPETPLYNGGNVILEYLDNECTNLDDVSDYITQTWQTNTNYSLSVSCVPFVLLSIKCYIDISKL